MTRAICLLLAILSSSASAFKFFEDEKVSIIFENTGPSPLGIFYIGNETERRLYNIDTSPPEMAPVLDYEALTEVLYRGEFAVHKTHFHHAFELRTADFQFRVKVTVYKNFHKEIEHLPYIIMIKNLMSEQKEDGSLAFVELKHSNTGYVWIAPEDEVAHGSDEAHVYELRNAEKESIMTCHILHGHPEL